MLVVLLELLHPKRIWLQAVALFAQNKTLIWAAELILSKSLLKFFCIMKHYPCIIRKTSWFLISSSAFSWIWTSSPTSREVSWSETLWNILACDWSARTSDNFLAEALHLRLSDWWSMVDLEVWANWHAYVYMGWVHLMAIALGRSWEMIYTSSSLFDCFVLFKISICWLHQSLRSYFSIYRVAFTNRIDTLRDYLALLVAVLNLSRSSSRRTSWLERVAASLAQRMLLLMICHIFTQMFICVTRSDELNLAHACHEATLILMYQVS